MKTIYIDTYICVNFFIDYLILVFVRKILRISSGHIRVIFAAFISSLCSLAVFLPFYTRLFSAFYILLTSSLIVFIAYGKSKINTQIVRIVTFIGTSLGFSGLIILLWLWIKPQGVTIYKGRVYFNISPLMLIVCTIIAFITLSVYERIKKKSKRGVSLKNVTIISNEYQCTFKSQIDTGMNVKEPFSGLPVIIAEKELIGDYPQDNLRVIPYSTLSGEGALKAFKPKSVIIDGKEVKNGCYIAVCKGKLNGEIKSLMGIDITEGI